MVKHFQVTSFFNHIPSLSIGYALGSPAVDASGRYRGVSGGSHTGHARGWFEHAMLTYARNFTYSDVMEGTEVWVTIDEGGVRDIRVANELERETIAGKVGGWSVKEDANLNHRFT